jgi:hypothetical protein
VPVTLLGLVFMAREGLTFGNARRIAAEGNIGAVPATSRRDGAEQEPSGAPVARRAEKGAR